MQKFTTLKIIGIIILGLVIFSVGVTTFDDIASKCPKDFRNWAMVDFKQRKIHCFNNEWKSETIKLTEK